MIFGKKQNNELVAMNCPKCGGTLKFHGKNHTTCEYCGMSLRIEPGTTNIRINITGEPEKKKCNPEVIQAVIIAVILLIVSSVILVMTNATAKRYYKEAIVSLKHIGNGDAKYDSVKVCLAKIFDKEYKDITQKELNSIKYFSMEMEKDGKSLAYICKYSFEDYKDYDSFEAFQKTFHEARVPIHEAWDSDNLTMLKGLTCYEEGQYDFDKRVFSARAPITCLIGRMDLNQIITHVNPNKIDRLDIQPEGNEFDQIGKFKNLTELRYDALSEDIEDLDGLEQCKKLEKLYMKHVLDLSDVTAVETLQELKAFEMDSFRVDDIEFLEKLPELTVCNIPNVHVEDYSPLLKVPQLRELAICGIKDYSDLKKCKNLEKLVIDYDNEYEGQKYITNMDTLKELTIVETEDRLVRRGVVDISAFEQLPELESLSVVGNDWNTICVHGIEEMLNMESLQSVRFEYADLNMDNDKIKDNQHVKNITMIKTDDSNETSERFEFLKHFTGVEELTMMQCELYDIEIVKNMENLEVCNVEHNYISDYTPLKDKQKLKRLYCGDNSIVEVDLGQNVMVEKKPLYTIEN